MTIVKVQLPLSPGDMTEGLVYAKNHDRQSLQTIEPTIREAMKKRGGIGAFKSFFEAEWDEQKCVWMIGPIVEDQSW
jgi:hypothetical protein